MAQNVPINQQNALPIATIAQATPGALLMLGGQVSRYYSPDDLGLNLVAISSGVFNPGAITAYWLATPYLDMRGCKYFSVVVKRTTTAGGAGLISLPSCTPEIQIRQTVTDAPPVYQVNGGSLNNELPGMFIIKTGAVMYPAAGGIGEEQRVIMAWGAMQLGSYGAAVAVGTDMRFVLRFFNTLVDPTNRFTVSVWAGS